MNMLGYQDEYFWEIPDDDWSSFTAALTAALEDPDLGLTQEWINGLLADFNYSFNGAHLGRISTMDADEVEFMDDYFSMTYGVNLYTKSQQNAFTFSG